MIGFANAGTMRRAVWTAVMVAVCALPSWALLQRPTPRPERAQPRNFAPRQEPRREQPPAQRQNFQQQRNAQRWQQDNRQAPRGQANPQYGPGMQPRYGNAMRGGGMRQEPMQAPSGNRPAYTGNGAGQSPNVRYPYQAPGYGARPRGNVDYPRYMQPGYRPPGHLGAWLNQHRGVPVQQQEQLLRRDPNFNRLPPQSQRQLLQQLHSVDQMPAAQRDRRLARAEALERMSPQQRAQVNQSAQMWRTLPTDRRTVLGNAFRDLRGVPPDQRGIMLNSERYRRMFSPEERGMLANLLSVEPYEPQR